VPSPCDIPGVGQLCNTVGDGITAAAGSIFDAAAQKLAEGLADATKVVMTFWTDLPMPQLSTSTGPVAALQSMTYWVSGFVAVLSMVIAAGQMAWSRSGEPAGRAAKGILTLIIASGAGVAAVNALGYFGDQYSQWILDRSANGDLGARLDALSKISIIPGLGSGLVLIVSLVAILASLAQMGLMLVRIGVVTMLAGTLPLAAAGTATATGQASFQRVVAWLLAFVLYKPAAATVYASAFLLVGQGQDAAAVLSGLFMMILAIVALPALLRLITPAVAAATSSGAAGGAAAAAGIGAVATGARMVADRGGRGSPQPQGSANPGLVGTSPAGGPGGSRSAASGSAAGTARGAGSAGAASATAGGAGVAAAVGTPGASLVVAGAAKAAQAATTGAKSAASAATGDDGQ